MSHNFDFASQNFNRLFDLLSQICFSVIILTKNLKKCWLALCSFWLKSVCYFKMNRLISVRWYLLDLFLTWISQHKTFDIQQQFLHGISDLWLWFFKYFYFSILTHHKNIYLFLLFSTLFYFICRRNRLPKN